MMKKLRIIVALFILTFSFSVKAEVFMEIDCSNKDVTNEKSATCEGNLVYEEVSINDIDFEYETNLDIEFTAMSGFSLSKSGNKISIHSSTPLFDEIMDSRVIMKFTVKGNDNSKENEEVTLKNIRINNGNEVIVEDVSETFKVDITKPTPVLDSDCFLTSITVDKVIVPNFNKDILEYRITVNKNIVTIDAVRSSEKSSASGLGEEFIKPGETIEHKITVVAEDKTEKVYKLYITNNSKEEEKEEVNSIGMELSKDNTLKTLELYNGKEKIPFTYNNKKNSFDIIIENSELKKITIKATVNYNKATFVENYGPRDVNVKLGNNKILIKVKAENNDEKVYTLNIDLKESKNSDNTLSSLKINDETINLVEKVYEYEVVLPNDVTKTKIEVIANNEKATVDFKDIDLVDGDNKVVIKVTAENGDKKEYNINIVRSDKTTLQGIKVDGYALGFLKDKKEYILKVDADTNELKIIVTPSNIDYEISGNENLTDGSIIKIKVNSISGEEEYKIVISKEVPSESNNLILYIIISILVVALIIVLVCIIKKKKKNNTDVEVI